MATIVCAQLDLCVGDTAGNLRQVLAAIEAARETHRADILIFPELTLTGYPPEDLLYRGEYLESVEQALLQVQQAAIDIAVFIGHPYRHEGVLYNAVSVFEHQALVARYCKQFLPNMQVFDERRYFEPGMSDAVVTLGGVRYVLAICEDIWHVEMVEKIRLAQGDVLLVLNASPFSEEKPRIRNELLKDVAAYLEHPIVYVNLVGGQDELLFDGGSCAFNRKGECISQAPWFEACLWPVVLKDKEGMIDLLPGTVTPRPSREELIYRGLVMGTRDYCHKNGFTSATLGLSGGIDSALTLAVLSDALGPQAVHPVYLPSMYSSELSRTGAQAQCDAMGIKLHVIPIDAVVNTTERLLEEAVGTLASVTTQNVQSRTRAMLLMGTSNQTGSLLMSTGNKSEFAVGYATLYGDMAGAYAPLKDVYKMDVYRLARYRNGLSPVIPEMVIDRAPSAELALNQKDEDDLPPYAILDAVLKSFIEGGESLDELIRAADTNVDIARIIRLLHRNEFKRRQAPPGPKVTSLAFGKDRRYPITSKFGK